MKFFGTVGFFETNIEISPDVFKDGIVERRYTGDILRASRNYSPSSYQNDALRLTNRISILSDLYARQNWSCIKYVIWNGAKLKVTNVEIDFPRITLEIGGVYNGNDPVRVEPETSPDL